MEKTGINIDSTKLEVAKLLIKQRRYTAGINQIKEFLIENFPKATITEMRYIVEALTETKIPRVTFTRYYHSHLKPALQKESNPFPFTNQNPKRKVDTIAKEEICEEDSQKTNESHSSSQPQTETQQQNRADIQKNSQTKEERKVKSLVEIALSDEFQEFVKAYDPNYKKILEKEKEKKNENSSG